MPRLCVAACTTALASRLQGSPSDYSFHSQKDGHRGHAPKILCPVDFSDLSLNALRFGVELVSTSQAELHLLHVFEGYDAISLNPKTAMIPMPQWLTELWQICHEKLAALPSADLAARCPAIVRAHREGPAIHEILEYSAHQKIDLIVLATHGRTGLRHLLMGSVTENVVRSASCPVLTIRGTDS